MPKIWKLIEYNGENTGIHNSQLVSRLLFSRGIREKEEAELFLDPQYEDLHSPFLFKDMQKAVERIWQAVTQGEKITVYGDYDADAVTANAVLCQTFKVLGANFDYYIPDRFSEGYGVNLEALEKIRDQGSKVIITVDCGTNSLDAAEFCRSSGIDFIVTDHHEIIDQKPDCLALINPKNFDDTYPYTEITGVGVAFKLACAILQNPKTQIRNPKLKTGWEKWLLDLVAIGTVADCHSLLGENRILVKYGLKVLSKSKWQGLRVLCRTAGLDFVKKEPDTYTLGFVLAPRLNAAGRLEHANLALELLLEENWDKAVELAETLEQVNIRRQKITEQIMSEAKELAEKISDRKVLVLMGEKEVWHKGVVGLVAGRLAETYNKPVIVLANEGSLATGSARSSGGFNIVEALKHASGYLERYGGHKQAAGLSLLPENFEKFYLKLLEYADKELSENQPSFLELEGELAHTDINETVLRELKMFEPFGVSNPKPRFWLKEADVSWVRAVGKESQHLQLKLGLGQREVSAIAFGFGKMAEYINGQKGVELAVEYMEDNWNGQNNIKLKIIDIRNFPAKN